MADTITTPIPTPEPAKAHAAAPSKPKVTRAAALNKLYALPAPLRTFPLPTLIPHNPVSLFHVLYVWLSQTINPPSSNFETLYQGWWSPETRSVHVTDSRSIRGLWEQGFYGKGSLSRSEPNWSNGQRARRGGKGKSTSEDLTKQRRAERQQTKWERARKEREAIEQKLLEEAEAALAVETLNTADSTSTDEETLIESDTSVTISDNEGEFSVVKELKIFQSPVGPLELLSLPNSWLELKSYTATANGTSIDAFAKIAADPFSTREIFAAPVGPQQILALPNSFKDVSVRERVPLEDHKEVSQAIHHSLPKVEGDTSIPHSLTNGNGSVHGVGLNDHAKATEPHMNGTSDVPDEAINGSVHSDDTVHTNNHTPNGSTLSNGITGTPKMKRQKSVRFSPTVEKNTFIQNEPPSPEHAMVVTTTVQEGPESLEEVVEQEHFQLTLEEAFFLSYSLGALMILDPITKSPIPNKELFALFRKASYFPPLTKPSLAPDDPFMVNYVVYHHFRSLGWVVRGGVKFAVDFMLYNRGPVFSHAEFGVVILPSYSDPYWSSDVFRQNYVRSKEKRTWAWFHCINRVISQVKKTLILVYVDIPKPLDEEVERGTGVDGVLGRYKVREVVMQRWLSNRQRD